MKKISKKALVYGMVGLVALLLGGTVVVGMFAIGPNDFMDVVFLYPNYHSVVPGYGESMIPVIKDGDYLIIRWGSHPNFNVDVGDIVVYIPPSQSVLGEQLANAKVLICHKIVATNQEKNRYIMQGFGNVLLDRWEVPIENVIGKILTIIDRNDWLSFTVSEKLVGNEYPSWVNRRLAGN